VIEDGYNLFKESPRFQANYAWLLLENGGDSSKALDLAQTAYEKLPDNDAVADTLGWAYYHKGIYSQAIWILTDIAQKNPHNGDILFHLGMAHYKNGNLEKATRFLGQSGTLLQDPEIQEQIQAALNNMKAPQNIDGKSTNVPDAILSFPGTGDKEIDDIQPMWE